MYWGSYKWPTFTISVNVNALTSFSYASKSPLILRPFDSSLQVYKKRWTGFETAIT